MIVVVDRKITKGEIKKASEEFGSFIKLVVDVENNILAAGGKLHADAEKVLIGRGSLQRNVWGGGWDLKTGKIDAQAMINLRPNQGNDGTDILDPAVREEFLRIVREFLL